MIPSKTTAGVPRDSATQSLWQPGVQFIETSEGSFNPEQTYDALIIGAGITGLTTALQLQQAGLQCVIAEAHTIGYGTTGGTTCHINTMLDNPYDVVEQNFGEAAAKLVGQSALEAIDMIAANIDQYHIDCGFEYKTGYLYAETADEAKELDKILEASQKAGVAVDAASEIPVPVPFEKAIAYSRQAQMHPLKYLYALAQQFTSQGGVILQNTLIGEVKTTGDVSVASSQNRAVRARNVIYATHIPPGINLLHFRCAPYRSYVLAATLADNNYPGDLAYDMKDPYHYMRTQEIDGQKYLILGGEDHKTGHGDPAQSFQLLEEYLERYFKGASVNFRWSSQYFDSTDGLPYIGRLPGSGEGIYTATGYSGNGIIFGTIAGKILSDLVQGKENVYAGLFAPSRIKPVAGFSSFVKENADAAYHFITDRFRARDVESLNELEPDSGAVIDYQDQKLAVYKDAAGEVHALNPVCTHAKCIVNWNNVEKSWDCPCHGGRFDCNGKVLTGPVSRDLQQVSLAEEERG